MSSTFVGCSWAAAGPAVTARAAAGAAINVVAIMAVRSGRIRVPLGLTGELRAGTCLFATPRLVGRILFTLRENHATRDRTAATGRCGRRRHPRSGEPTRRG